MSAHTSLRSQIRDLRRLDQEALAAIYQRLYGSPAPDSISRPLLEAAAGYRLQKQLIAYLQHRLIQMLTAGEAIVEAAAIDHEQALLIGVWRGQAHTVIVVDDGEVLYQGQIYPSLEAVATQITRGKQSAEALFRLRPSATPERPAASGVSGR